MTPVIASTTWGFAVPKELYNKDSPTRLVETKGLYRKFKRYRQVTRKRDDIILELDDDESALISCVFQRNRLFVWSPTIMHSKDIVGASTVVFAYLCVLRDGLWLYPGDQVRDLLLQEGDTVSMLDTWEEDQQNSRESLLEMLELYKKGKF